MIGARALARRVLRAWLAYGRRRHPVLVFATQPQEEAPAGLRATRVEAVDWFKLWPLPQGRIDNFRPLAEEDIRRCDCGEDHSQTLPSENAVSREKGAYRSRTGVSLPSERAKSRGFQAGGFEFDGELAYELTVHIDRYGMRLENENDISGWNVPLEIAIPRLEALLEAARIAQEAT